MSVLLTIVVALFGAQRVPYGGEIRAVSAGGPIVPDPSQAASLTDFVVARAVFEPLYRLGDGGVLTPVLAAGPPEFDGEACRVPIRPNVRLHDGRTLTADDVARALTRLGGPDSRAGYVLSAVAGANRGKPEIRAEGNIVRIRFEAPYPEVVRLFASIRAGITLDGRVGSGPFALAAGGPLALVPHLPFRDGRPYLDRIDFERLPTPFAARALLRRGHAALAIGLSDIDIASMVEARPAHANELILLSLGNRNAALMGEPARLAIDAALNRERLTKKYLPAGARPTRTLVGDFDGSSPASLASLARIEATLLVATEGSPGLRFAERVQLDLLRAGIAVTIERASGETLDQRRAKGDYDLLLDAVPIEPSVVGDAADGLHALLAMASFIGRSPQIIDAPSRISFARADEAERRALLVRLERTYRVSTRLIPVALRQESVWLSQTLAGARVGRDGILHLEDAYRVQ